MIEKKPEASPRRPRPYRQLRHTADLAWRLWGKISRSSLKTPGGALSATLTDRRYLRGRAIRQVRLTADNQEALLVDWLNHLLYLFDIDGFLGRDFQVESLTPENLEARVSGESFDPARHPDGLGSRPRPTIS